MKTRKSQRFTIIALSGFIFGMSASAQQPTIERVTAYRVKPDRSADFEAEIKEYLAVLKKANPSHAYSIWSSLSGNNEFYRVDVYAKYAELDENQDPKLKEVSQDLTRIGLRINNCADSMERVYYRIRTDLSLPPTQDIPKMLLVLKVKVQRDKIDDYVAMKKEYLELMKKSPVKFEAVLEGRFGASAREFITLSPLNSWADLDGPSDMEKIFGADALRKFNFSAMQTERQTDVIRYRPELSYTPVAGTN